MIDQTIECSVCNEPVSVFARSVHFPFVCDSCVSYCGDPGDESDVVRVVEDLDTGTDTDEVEDTNALISDLEAQLEQANADREGLMDDVVSLGNQLEYMLTLSTFVIGELQRSETALEESQKWENLSHEALGRVTAERDREREARSMKELRELMCPPAQKISTWKRFTKWFWGI